MPDKVTINVEWFWRWTEADGNQCGHCGDAVYLRQASVYMRVGRNEPELVVVLCQSCGDVLEETIPPIG